MSSVNLGPGTVQSEDGELVDVDRITAHIRPERTPHPYRRFITMNADAVVTVVEMGLTPLELRLFFRVVAEMPIGNVGAINQSLAAKKLGTSRESINKALASLNRRGMLEKIRTEGSPLVWKVNPEYAWKGESKKLVKEYQQIRRKKMFAVIEGGKKDKPEEDKQAAFRADVADIVSELD